MLGSVTRLGLGSGLAAWRRALSQPFCFQKPRGSTLIEITKKQTYQQFPKTPSLPETLTKGYLLYRNGFTLGRCQRQGRPIPSRFQVPKAGGRKAGGKLDPRVSQYSPSRSTPGKSSDSTRLGRKADSAFGLGKVNRLYSFQSRTFLTPY
jgi:hypothetical protein